MTHPAVQLNNFQLTEIIKTNCISNRTFIEAKQAATIPSHNDIVRRAIGQK